MKTKKQSLDFNLLPVSNECLIWQLWMLKIVGQKTEIVLFYSWILPNEFQRDAGWQPAVTAFSKQVQYGKGKQIRIEILKTDFIGSGVAISEYLTQMLSGKNLSEITVAGVNSPIPNAFLNLSLAMDDFTIRDEVFLPIEHASIPWRYKALPNPNFYSCFVTQIFYLPKLRLLSFSDYVLDPSTIKKLIGELADQFKLMTGFDIRHESAPRIGNIEWFRLPVSNVDLEPLIFYQTVGVPGLPASAVKIDFHALFERQRNVLVRCRIINGEEIALDEIRELIWSDSPVTLTFHSPLPVGEIMVTVWEKNFETGAATVLFEQSNSCVRTIHTKMNITGSQFNTGKINWLKKLNGNEQSKGKALTQFSRSTLASNTTIDSFENDPWIPSSHSIIDFMVKTYPEKSEGQFFLNGWDEAQGVSGQLSFIEWFFKLISGDDQTVLFFIDPYFDASVIEIFAHARTTNTQYRILTCTQHREDDDKSCIANPVTGNSEKIIQVIAVPSSEPKAATEITAMCQSMLPLLKGLDLSITDLRSIGGGKQPLFHDRYLLIASKDGLVTNGYHFSNSLQGATKRAPLLVTPIPLDILPNVFNYVEELIDPQSKNSKKTTLTQLYPSATNPSGQSVIIQPDDGSEANLLKKIPNVGPFFASFLNESSLKSSDFIRLAERLIELGIIDKQSNSFQFQYLSIEALQNFAEKLLHADQREFNSLMLAFGECLARAHTTNHQVQPPSDMLASLIELFKKSVNIADKIQYFLADFRCGTRPLDDNQRLYIIFQCENFENMLLRTFSQISHFSGDLLGIDYPYYYACKILAYSYPSEAARLLIILVDEVKAGGWNEADVNLKAKMLLISTLTARLLQHFNYSEAAFKNYLLTASDYRVRAIAAAPLLYCGSYNPKNETNFETLELQLRRSLPDDEYRLVIAALISELCVREGHLGHAQEWLKFAYEALISNWIGNDVFISRVVIVLSGRLPSNYSYNTSLNFLDKLVELGKLESKWCFQLWNKALIEKITYREKYISGSSQTLPFHFSSNTDIELTKSIYHYFTLLTNEEQLEIIKNWLSITQSMWQIIRQPFALQIDFNNYGGATERIGWLITILSYLQKKDAIKASTDIFVANFFTNYQPEIARVQRHEENRTLSPMKELSAVFN